MNPPFFRKTILACGITAVVETILILSITEPPLLVLPLGSLLFLIVIAWRRRTHPARARRIQGLAVGIGTFGIACLGVAFLMHRNNPEPQAIPIAPIVVPIVQWLVVLGVWLGISRAESAEKRQKQSPST